MSAPGEPEDLDAFERYLAAAGVRSPHSRRAYLGVIRRQLASGLAPLAWAIEQLAEAPSGTASQIRAALRHWRVYQGEPELDIPRGARRRRLNRAPLSAQDLARFYRVITHAPFLGPAARALLLLLPRTGLRVSEACAVRLEDVRTQEGTWGVRVRRGKGGHERFVPLTEEAHRVLRVYIEAHRQDAGAREPVFPGESGQPLPADTVRHALRRLRGGSTWSPHVLRHTFATRYYHATEDLLGLMEILGHRSIETTREYVQASAHHKRAGMEAAELREPRSRRPRGARRPRGGR